MNYIWLYTVIYSYIDAYILYFMHLDLYFMRLDYILGVGTCLLGVWTCILGVWTCILGGWTCLLGVWTCLLGVCILVGCDYGVRARGLGPWQVQCRLLSTTDKHVAFGKICKGAKDRLSIKILHFAVQILPLDIHSKVRKFQDSQRLH